MEAQELEVFDATKKKKKKKMTVAPLDKDDEQLQPFDATQKKKKKKKKVHIVEAVTPAAPPLEKDDNASIDDYFTDKKKKKKKAQPSLQAIEPDTYDYFTLLDRVYQRMGADGKKSVSASKDLDLPSISLAREGTTKTIWSNFSVFCRHLQRDQRHLMEFVLVELGTSGSLDASKALTIKGRFQEKQLERVVRHYVVQFVKCKQCNGNRSQLRRENRLDFICCLGCGSKRSVEGIKRGYQAKTKYHPK